MIWDKVSDSTTLPGNCSPAAPKNLQEEGAKSFDESWQDLLNAIAAKTKSLKA